MDRCYKVVDVFAARPLRGNPVAVVLDAAALEAGRVTPRAGKVVQECGAGEDPVCGSGNGSVAAFRRARGLLREPQTNYVAAQGQCVGRDGRVAITVDGEGRVTVGGTCVTAIEGVLRV